MGVPAHEPFLPNYSRGFAHSGSRRMSAPAMYPMRVASWNCGARSRRTLRWRADRVYAFPNYHYRRLQQRPRLVLRVLGLEQKKVWMEDPVPFTRTVLELARLSIEPIPLTRTALMSVTA